MSLTQVHTFLQKNIHLAKVCIYVPMYLNSYLNNMRFSIFVQEQFEILLAAKMLQNKMYIFLMEPYHDMLQDCPTGTGGGGGVKK